MGDAEKELEGSVLDVGNRILAPPTSVDELLPLLDQAETFLSRVEQSPSDTMLAALHPAMAGLTAMELLRHSDTDVKVAVASCISEITRITAPEAPYDDDLMKEVFEMIVEAFRKLDDIYSRSYLKRVSILETVANVRSCAVMLDLECDSLILEMFHHFLNTIRDNHPENVFCSMEMIMTLVLEESEDISSDLLSCLLVSVKRSNKDILPIARKLAEKVIGNCAFKLKSSLLEVVQSMGDLLGYSKIVASICQGSSDVLEQNGVNVPGDCLAGESKVSERVVSAEIPQGLQKLELEIASPEVSAATVKLSRSSMSNGTVRTGNDNSSVEPTLPSKKTEHSCHSTLPKNAGAARLDAEKLDTSLDHGNKRRKGRSREVKMMPLESRTDNSASVILATDNGNLPDSSRPKRGRSSGSKLSVKKVGRSPAGDVPVSLSGSKKYAMNGNIENEAANFMDIVTKKQTEVVSDSEKKPLRHSGKKGRLKNLDNGVESNSHTAASMDAMADPEEKPHKRPGRKPQTKMARGGEASRQHQTSRKKRQRGRVSSEDIAVYEPNQKGMISIMSTPTTKANNDQSLSVDGLKTKSRRKGAQEQTSETSRKAIKYDESLVGVRIKVWWPDDEQFYLGVVDSYDPSTMRHKVFYADGDEEILLLKDEIVQFLSGEKEENDSTPEVAVMPRKKAKLSDSSVKRSNVVSSSKGGGSAGKVSASGTKLGRKRRLNSTESTGGRGGVSSKADGSPPTESAPKEKKRRRQSEGTPKGIMSEDELNSKSKDESPRPTPKEKKRRRQSEGTPKGIILFEDELNIKWKDESPRPTKIKDNAKPGRKSKSGSVSKDGTAKTGSAKCCFSTPGSMAKDDVAVTGSKPKQKVASPGKRSKSDANGSAKVKTGASKQRQSEHIATKVDSNPPVLQEILERSGKKRRKKPES